MMEIEIAPSAVIQVAKEVDQTASALTKTASKLTRANLAANQSFQLSAAIGKHSAEAAESTSKIASNIEQMTDKLIASAKAYEMADQAIESSLEPGSAS